MPALRLTNRWPVVHASAGVVGGGETLGMHGDPDRVYRLASISKVLAAYATLIAVEEGIVRLDEPVGQPGCTLRHLLAHAGGYSFDGAEPIAPPGRSRIYSNTGIELACTAVARAAGMPFSDYLAEGVFNPLGMTSSSLRGSPAHQVFSSLRDLTAFAAELQHPRLITHHSAAALTTVQFPMLGGVLPGIGSFDINDWGLGAEIRGTKQPHWTGAFNSPSTFGHFGGAGTFMWVDPVAELACIALTDRNFDEWQHQALMLWPQLSDAVLNEFGR